MKLYSLQLLLNLKCILLNKKIKNDKEMVLFYEKKTTKKVHETVKRYLER